MRAENAKFISLVLLIALCYEVLYYIIFPELQSIALYILIHATGILCIIFINIFIISIIRNYLNYILFLYTSAVSIVLFLLNSTLLRGAYTIFDPLYLNLNISSSSTAFFSTAFFIFLIMILNYISVCAIARYIENDTRYNWWNFSTENSTNPPDWNSVFYILCKYCSDPALHPRNSTVYLKGNKDIIIISSWITVSILFFSILLDYIAFPRIPLIFLDGSNIQKVISLSQNLTALLALIAAAISIAFTYQQLQAKVRAKSRQAWLNEVKRGVSEILSILRKSKFDNMSERKLLSKFQRRLEIQLNPSELDHRLLMLLIRAYSEPKLQLSYDTELAKTYSRFPIVKWVDDIEMRNGAILSGLLCTYIYPDFIASREEIVSENREIIISFIYKLSYSLLKREWERVRNTQ